MFLGDSLTYLWKDRWCTSGSRCHSCNPLRHLLPTPPPIFPFFLSIFILHFLIAHIPFHQLLCPISWLLSISCGKHCIQADSVRVEVLCPVSGFHLHWPRGAPRSQVLAHQTPARWRLLSRHGPHPQQGPAGRLRFALLMCLHRKRVPGIRSKQT